MTWCAIRRAREIPRCADSARSDGLLHVRRAIELAASWLLGMRADAPVSAVDWLRARKTATLVLPSEQSLFFIA